MNYSTNIVEWTVQLQFYINVERVITTIGCISLPLPLQLLSLSLSLSSYQLLMIKSETLIDNQVSYPFKWSDLHHSPSFAYVAIELGLPSSSMSLLR